MNDLTQEQIESYFRPLVANLERHGDQWRGTCPLHESHRNDSLSVNVDTGLWTCYSECGSGNIYQFESKRLGIPEREAYKSVRKYLGVENSKVEKHKHQWEFVESYQYTDPRGNLLYEVVRQKCSICAQKTFYQRRPKEGGGWVNNLGPIKPVLYRMPAVQAANICCIGEGERDVHSLEALGFTATCNSGGAGRWAPEFSDMLAGKHVIIFPDKDQVGEEHAITVAKSLKGKALSVRIIRPAKGKDITDWIKAGATEEVIRTAIECAPEYGTAEIVGSTTSNPQLERKILSVSIRDEEALEEVRASITSKDLTQKPLRNIFDAALAIVERGGSVNEPTILAELQARDQLEEMGGEQFLSEILAERAEPDQALSYCQSLRQFSYRRRLSWVAGQIIELARSPDSASSISERIQKMVRFLEDDTDPQGILLSMGDVVDQMGLNNFLSPMQGKVFVDTEWEAFNNLIIGFFPGTQNIIGGRPGSGKSAFAAQICLRAALHGIPCAYFSLEMKADSVFRRLACCDAVVDNYALKKNAATKEERFRLVEAVERMRKAPLRISDLKGHRISDIARAARAFKAENGKLGAVVVDHIQLMNPMGKYKDRREMLTEVSKELKRMSGELDTAIITLSQVTRESAKRESKRPQLTDFMESGAIEQDADTGTCIVRPDLDKKDGDKAKTEVYVLKQRDGMVGEFPLRFLGRYFRFESPTSTN